MIARVGLVRGMHALFAVTILLALITLVVVTRVQIAKIAGAPANIRGVWASFPSPLRWLLLSDVFIRTCEGMVDEFGVIYLMSIVGVSAPQYGVLIAVQMVTAIVVYIPAAKIADRIGRKPFVIATFTAFALFPLSIVLSPSFHAAIAAYVIGGLREIGEPSRKALIVDFAQPALRARSVGLYYLIRSVAIAPAAFVGGLLWERNPALTFFTAITIGIAGTILFSMTVAEEHAG